MKKQAWWLIFPGLLITLVFVICPMAQVMYPTFTIGQGFGHLYVQFLQDVFNQRIIVRTIGLSLATTLITLLFSFPLSFWISRQRNKVRNAAVLIILFPMLTNSVVINFTWTIILGPHGVINETLMGLHLISTPLNILYNDSAIVVGSVYTFIPIMVISLIGGFSRLDTNLEKAAAVSGATRHVIFNKIIMPQMVPNLLTGMIWTFAWMMTAYATPSLLGSSKDMVLSTLIYQEATNNQDWTEAGVISLVLIVLSLVSLGLIKSVVNLLNRRANNV